MLLNTSTMKKSGTLDVIHSFAKEREIDILCMVESWPTPAVTDAGISGNGDYYVFRKDRGQRGSGVLVMVSSRLRCSQSLGSTLIVSELVCVDIYGEEDGFHLMTAYSASTVGPERSLDEMQTLCLSSTP